MDVVRRTFARLQDAINGVWDAASKPLHLRPRQTFLYHVLDETLLRAVNMCLAFPLFELRWKLEEGGVLVRSGRWLEQHMAIETCITTYPT